MNNQETNQVPSWSSSSANPSEISLTIASFGKVIAGSGLLGIIATVLNADPAIANIQWQAFIANTSSLVAAGYTAYHSGELIYGALRKLFFRIFGKKTVVSVEPVTVVNPTIQS